MWLCAVWYLPKCFVGCNSVLVVVLHLCVSHDAPPFPDSSSVRAIVALSCFGNKRHQTFSLLFLLVFLLSIPLMCWSPLKVRKQCLLSSRKVRLVGRWLVLHVPVGVEVRRIERVLDPGHPRRWDLLVQELVDINDVEPRVVANVHVATG